MQYYDHAMVGAIIAVAAGAQRRYGWPIVILAGLAGAFPDWDAISKQTNPAAYQAAHRAWGHNLFAVTLAGIVMGTVGYLIHQSTRAKSEVKPSGAMVWIVVCIGIMWTHPILDMLYCGLGREAEWPVKLFWPLTSDGFAGPWVSWADWGATLILSSGLLVIVAGPFRQATATLSLGLLVAYIGIRGAMTQW